MKVVVIPQDYYWKSLYAKMRAMGNNISRKEMLRFLKENRKKLFPHRAVEGMVCSGLFEQDTDVREKLHNINKNLADDFVIIREGKVPSLGTALGEVGVAIILFALGLAGWFKGRGNSRDVSCSLRAAVMRACR